MVNVYNVELIDDITTGIIEKAKLLGDKGNLEIKTNLVYLKDTFLN
jgi:hypothetical protein